MMSIPHVLMFVVMARLRDLSALVLLAAFFVGGVASPVVHRIHHSLEQRRDEATTPCHRLSVHHAEGSVWADHAESRLRPECDLCATRLLVAPPSLAPHSVPRVVGTSLVAEVSHVAPAHVVRDRTIRGPPHFFGSRLA